MREGSLELGAGSDDFGRALGRVALERLVEHALGDEGESAEKREKEGKKGTHSELLQGLLVRLLVAPRSLGVEDVTAREGVSRVERGQEIGLTRECPRSS